jgi:hypothetical protein
MAERSMAHAWKLIPLTRAAAHRISPTHLRSTTFPTALLAIQTQGFFACSFGRPAPLRNALIDRLTHDAEIISIDGESYRKREAVRKRVLPGGSAF